MEPSDNFSYPFYAMYAITSGIDVVVMLIDTYTLHFDLQVY